MAVGFNALAGQDANSVGSGQHTTAIGSEAWATEDGATVVGYNSYAQATNATVLGSNTWTTKAADNSVALGAGSLADRANAVSVGAAQDWVDAAGVTHSAINRQVTNVAAGTQATDAVNKGQLDVVAATADATGRHFRATGTGTASATGSNAVAVGSGASASGNRSNALGSSASAIGNAALAVGANAGATGANSVALGSGARALDANVVSVGGGNGTDGPATRRIVNVADGRIAAGSSDAVTGSQLNVTNQRVGAVETRVGDFDSRIATVETSTANAVGYDDASRDRLTLAGIEGTTIDNVGAGSIAAGSRQAINGGQLFQSLSDAASFLGGGASVGMQGVFVAPNYVIQGASYSNVGDALGALDRKVSEIDQRTGGADRSRTASLRSTGASLEGGAASLAAQPASADAVPDVATASSARVQGAPTAAAAGSGIPVGTPAAGFNAVTVGEGAVASGASSTAIGQGASATAANAVALGQGSVADRANTVSVGSEGNERQVTNVAAGSAATDAVNKGQLDRGVATANSYTDGQVKAVTDSFDVFKGEVDGRLRHMDRRIDRQGAMSAAMLNMATSAAGIRTQNRVGVGVGFQGGESALSLGYQRAISDRATVTFGGAFSSDDSSVGVGAGFGW
ncbi:YadA family autotransporter adhesin [Stenotrophomonas maltophilia]|uniref:YadA family autotransporter adhesin n=1 Tax=Stenotrophomonas maltophilia TaxID=40324 RepID=UPI003D2F86AD